MAYSFEAQIQRFSKRGDNIYVLKHVLSPVDENDTDSILCVSSLSDLKSDLQKCVALWRCKAEKNKLVTVQNEKGGRYSYSWINNAVTSNLL